MDNLFDKIPAAIAEEISDSLLSNSGIEIKRILSKGQSSPAIGWYEQVDNEWVVVLQGEAILAFEHEVEKHLQAGDFCFIPAAQKHRVKWTPADQVTVWLAIYFPATEGL